LEHADAVAERFELATTQLAVAASGERARLRIGAFPTALAGFVPAAIARLRIRFPDTKVRVDEGTDDLPARVRSGELHLAVGFEDAAEPRQELALRPITGPGPGRNVYAMLPPGGRHPLVTPALDALHSIATELQVAGSA